jgi:putative Ca2+/H+ antiporter (TMEM165/GDT1 family)
VSEDHHKATRVHQFSEDNVKQFGVIFLTILVAELGDKTQLATLLYTSERAISPIFVFFAAAAALVCSTAIAVFVGASLGRIVPETTLKVVAGIAFVGVGLYTIVSAVYPR